MDRAPVAISLLLAAAASFAAEPPAAAPDAAEATAAPLIADAAEPIDPVASAEAAARAAAPADLDVAPAAASTETTFASTADDAPPPVAAPAAVPTIDIKKVTDDTVCRKERPTGSQIGITRCYSRSASTLEHDEQLRRDIDEMRMRQNEQQAREAAAAMARRAGRLP